MPRLETVSTDLVERLRVSNPLRQRAAALAAAKYAVSTTKISYPAVTNALLALQAGREMSAQQKAELNSLAAELDEQYLKLQETREGSQESADVYLKVFGQARAVTAVLFAGSDDPLEAATEAIYEATATTDRPSDILSVIEAEL